MATETTFARGVRDVSLARGTSKTITKVALESMAIQLVITGMTIPLAQEARNKFLLACDQSASKPKRMLIMLKTNDVTKRERKTKVEMTIPPRKSSPKLITMPFVYLLVLGYRHFYILPPKPLCRPCRVKLPWTRIQVHIVINHRHVPPIQEEDPQLLSQLLCLVEHHYHHLRHTLHFLDVMTRLDKSRWEVINTMMKMLLIKTRKRQQRLLV